MTVICGICATPEVRGYVDADLIRHRSLRSIAEKHKLSLRSVRRHLKHVPSRLESEASAAAPSVYIGQVTYNFNVLVCPPAEEGEPEISDLDLKAGGGGQDLGPEEARSEEGEHPGDGGDLEEGLGHA